MNKLTVIKRPIGPLQFRLELKMQTDQGVETNTYVYSREYWTFEAACLDLIGRTFPAARERIIEEQQ